MGPQNKWVEVQIRTRRMDEIAERGLAAHWKYKGGKAESGLDEFLNTVRAARNEREQPARPDAGFQDGLVQRRDLCLHPDRRTDQAGQRGDRARLCFRDPYQVRMQMRLGKGEREECTY